MYSYKSMNWKGIFVLRLNREIPVLQVGVLMITIALELTKSSDDSAVVMNQLSCLNPTKMVHSLI